VGLRIPATLALDPADTLAPDHWSKAVELPSTIIAERRLGNDVLTFSTTLAF